MINLLLLLFSLTCIGAVAAWLAENPGNVVIHWFGYRIDTSFSFLLLAALVAVIVLAYVVIFMRHVALAPDYYSRRRSLKQYQKGLSEITYSVAALAAADTKEALTHTQNAEKLLGQTPLILLLSAQISRSESDDARTRELLMKMLDHKETEFLAARSLSETAQKQHMFPKALALAKRAHALNPKHIAPLLSLHIRLGEWQQGMRAIEKSTRKGQLSRSSIRHYKALLLLKQGTQMLATHHSEAALVAAKRSLSLQPHFIPCIVFAAKAYHACGQDSKAIRLIYHAWKASPHEQLAVELRAIIAAYSKEKQIRIVRKLASYNPKSNESDIAVAQTAMIHKEWATARVALTAALEKAETVRTCKLLATLEEGEYPDFDIGSKWIIRSTTASADPAWICSACGYATAVWDSHCPTCNAFDSLEWKKREVTFVS